MIGIFITARCGSKRLSNKHFRKIGELDALEILLNRIKLEFDNEISNGSANIFIVTGGKSDNKNFIKYEKLRLADVYFGSNSNIPFRHQQAIREFDLDGVVAVDGDDILVCREALRSVFNELQNGTQFCKTVKFPFGMNAFGYSSSFLKKQKIGNVETVLETDWTKDFVGEMTILGSPDKDHSKLRLTLDYEDDLAFFRELLPKLRDYKVATCNDIISAVLANQLNQINNHLTGSYWLNFYENR